MITTGKIAFLMNILGVPKHHEHHIANVIDELLKLSDYNVEVMKLPTIDINNVAHNVDDTNLQSSVLPTIEAIIGSHCSKTSAVSQDFNIEDKHRGFLNHGPANFSFIGPDREPVRVESVEQQVNIAHIIKSTGKPNYTEARIPITSGLNISAWERALEDYPDQLLLQYLKFGFPLSIIIPTAPCNTNTQNHHSAMQFPVEVQE